MELKLRSRHGSRDPILLRVHSFESIAGLKARLAKELHRHAAELRIVVYGQQQPDERLLSDMGISDGHVVEFTASSTRSISPWRWFRHRSGPGDSPHIRRDKTRQQA